VNPVVTNYAPVPTTTYSVAPAAAATTIASPVTSFYAPSPVVLPAPVIITPWRQY
jgi:hypothetical protein